MTAKSSSGKPVKGISGKYSAPINNWFTFILNLAVFCANKYNFQKRTRWRKYEARHFWEVIVFGVLKNLGTEDAAEQWNKMKYAEMNRHLRRKKFPKPLGGKYPRVERLAPDRSQVNAFKRTFPRWFVRKLTTIVLKAQIDFAVEIGFLSNVIDIIIDFNDKPYYGKLKTSDNKSIIGTTQAPGTRKTRKFLGVVIKSGKTRLFTHFNLASQGVPHDVFVKEALEELLSWGFTLRRVLADRWFATRGVLEWCTKQKIEYIGPIKKLKGVKGYIHHFLKTGKKYIFSHEMLGSPSRYYGSKPLNVWVLLGARGGERLSKIRRKYLLKELTLEEATGAIYTFVVTKRPPRGKQRRAAWARGIAKIYKKRWYIETAFCDLNRIQPTFHARTDASKMFSMMMRCWLYNAWQMQRAFHRRRRGVPALWRESPTLRAFCTIMYDHDFKSTCFAT